MLGDKLGNVKGTVVRRRALPSASGAPRIESSQRGSGTLLGVEFQETSTYESEFRSDGTIFGSGQPNWKRLNAVAGVFEYAVDADDNYSSTLMEWK